jgi:hypothetical protein
MSEVLSCLFCAQLYSRCHKVTSCFVKGIEASLGEETHAVRQYDLTQELCAVTAQKMQKERLIDRRWYLLGVAGGGGLPGVGEGGRRPRHH